MPLAKLPFPVVIKTVELHTGGGPVRVVEDGYPEIKGKTILEKREYLRSKLDYLRTFLMHEPRGHQNMFGAIIVEPDLKEADIAVIFIHNEGYSTMCGHAVIALGRYVVDNQLNRNKPFVKDGKEYVEVFIQCPCGLVKATVELQDGKSGGVSFVSVPAFLAMKDVTLKTEEFGPVTVDIAYGGAFYVLVNDSLLNLNLEHSPLQSIVSAGMSLKNAAKSQLNPHHPDSDDLAFIFGTIIANGNDSLSSETKISNVCIFAESQADRCPCGSGTTARIAALYSRGLTGLQQSRTFRNARSGSEFVGMAVEETTCGSYPAVRVQVTGHARYTGECKFTYEEKDNMKFGFLI